MDEQRKWIRGSKCANCVEISTDGSHILMRDSRHPDKVIPVLIDEFQSFVDAVKRGEFDEFC